MSLALSIDRTKILLTNERLFKKGNFVDLAVAVLVGTAFQSIVTSFASDLLMPPIGLLLQSNLEDWYVILKRPANSTGVDWPTLAQAQNAGVVTWNIGRFLQTIVNFLLLCLCVFIFLRALTLARTIELTVEDRVFHVKFDNDDDNNNKPQTKQCPHCFASIDARALRCVNCLSFLQNKR